MPLYDLTMEMHMSRQDLDPILYWVKLGYLYVKRGLVSRKQV